MTVAICCHKELPPMTTKQTYHMMYIYIYYTYLLFYIGIKSETYKRIVNSAATLTIRPQ